jgi:cytochrome P450
LAPPLHGSRMRAYGACIAEVTRRHAARWRAEQPFAMQDTTMAISLDVIIETIFGVRGAARVKHVHQLVLELVTSLKPSIVVFRRLRRRFGGIGPWARFVAARQRLERVILDEIATRRAQPEERHDILSLLMELRYDDGAPLGDNEIVDQLFTLLVAGHETTATSLSWTFYWLGRTPAALAQLVAELDDAGDDLVAIERLPYLEAVCDETLRLCPIVPVVARRVTQPFELAGYRLPAGTGVAAALALAHFRPETFPDPHAFLPERFLGRVYGAFEYFPFGGGSRRCLGAAFALFEMKVVLATLLREHRLRLVDERVRPVARAASVGPSGGVRMQLERGRVG